CGDVNRNVISNVNPQLSHLHREIHELSLAISDRLRWRSGAYGEVWLGEERVAALGEEEEPFYGYKYLPRKFKIALAIPPENDCDVFANDIGLIAIVEDNRIQGFNLDRKSTRLNSSHVKMSYAVFCLKKKKTE